MKSHREELEASKNGGSSPNKITGSLDDDEESERDSMQRLREELEASNNGGSSQNKTIGSLDEKVKYPPLNLALTTTPEFIKQMESLLQRQQDSNTTPPGKTKPMRFAISKITIGEWTHEAVNEQDLKAKIYFPRQKIIWECLFDDESTTRLNRKFEMQWSDVLSLEPVYHPHDQTGILRVELRKPPTFFIETNPEAGKATKWQQLDRDFTHNHSASRYRIHTLHFGAGVLQENMEKLVSGDRFWSQLLKVRFPTLEHLYFEHQFNILKETQFHGNHESSNND